MVRPVSPLGPGSSWGHQVRAATPFFLLQCYFFSPFGCAGEIRTQLCLAQEPCAFLGLGHLSQAASQHDCVLTQMAPDYDHLTLMQKVEVFEHAVNNTAGDDLAKLLWLKSPSSEVHSTLCSLCTRCPLDHPLLSGWLSCTFLLTLGSSLS